MQKSTVLSRLFAVVQDFYAFCCYFRTTTARVSGLEPLYVKHRKCWAP